MTATVNYNKAFSWHTVCIFFVLFSQLKPNKVFCHPQKVGINLGAPGGEDFYWQQLLLVSCKRNFKNRTRLIISGRFIVFSGCSIWNQCVCWNTACVKHKMFRLLGPVKQPEMFRFRQKNKSHMVLISDVLRTKFLWIGSRFILVIVQVYVVVYFVVIFLNKWQKNFMSSHATFSLSVWYILFFNGLFVWFLLMNKNEK